MSDARWPALSAGGLSVRVTPGRGIYGKVHDQPTDYRWIGLSPTLAARARELERELSLGGVDGPATAAFWRALDDGTLIGMTCTPTRSVDAAGRSAVIERQMLVVNESDGNVVALALALLTAASMLRREPWWAQRLDPAWENPAYVWALGRGDVGAVEMSDLEVLALANQGARQLAEVTSEEALAVLYARLASGSVPAILRDLAEPLTPAATAALLLPLPLARARVVSVAGWTLSNANDLAALARRWTVQVLPQGARWRELDLASMREPGPWALAAARAIHSGDPSILAGMPCPEGADAWASTSASLAPATLSWATSPALTGSSEPEMEGLGEVPLDSAEQALSRGFEWVYDNQRRYWALPRAREALLQHLTAEVARSRESLLHEARRVLSIWLGPPPEGDGLAARIRLELDLALAAVPGASERALRVTDGNLLLPSGQWSALAFDWFIGRLYSGRPIIAGEAEQQRGLGPRWGSLLSWVTETSPRELESKDWMDAQLEDPDRYTALLAAARQYVLHQRRSVSDTWLWERKDGDLAALPGNDVARVGNTSNLPPKGELVDAVLSAIRRAAGATAPKLAHPEEPLIRELSQIFEAQPPTASELAWLRAVAEAIRAHTTEPPRQEVAPRGTFNWAPPTHPGRGRG